jgi:hypothetical protein
MQRGREERNKGTEAAEMRTVKDLGCIYAVRRKCIVLIENVSVVCIVKVTVYRWQPGLNTINSVKILLHVSFQIGSLFDPENGGDMFIRDVS